MKSACSGYSSFTATTLGTLLLFSGIVVALNVAGQQSASAGTFPGTNGKIAFVRGLLPDSSDWEIYTVYPDGSGVSTITSNNAADEDPSWSPDGTRIAFTSNRDENYEIYAMNADGSDPVRLTNSAIQDVDPSWSPDGTKIAFVRYSDEISARIYVMDSDGSNQEELTLLEDDLYGQPSWSPDGTKIAFLCGGTAGNSGICVANPDGSGKTIIVDNGDDTAGTEDPQWSPDGSRIVFATSVDGDGHESGDFEVAAVNVDGTGYQTLTPDDGVHGNQDVHPSYSPDGAQIVYSGSLGIWIMDSDGTNLINIVEAVQAQAFDTEWGASRPSNTYSLDLFDDGLPIEGPVGFNEAVTAIATAENDSNVSQVEFRWIKEGHLQYSTTVPVTDGVAQDIQQTNAGNWIVEADFGNGQVIQKTVEVSFFVVPESPIGVIAIVVSSLAVLGLFTRLRGKSHP